MLVKTASIELRRRNPHAVLASLHPGTVNSKLSRPVRGAKMGRSAMDAVAQMLQVVDRLSPADTGRFFSYNGAILPW